MTPTLRSAAYLAIVALSALIVPLPVALAGAVAVIAATIMDARSVNQEPDTSVVVPNILSRGVPASLRIETSHPTGTVCILQPTSPDLVLAERTAVSDLTTDINATRRGRHILEQPACRTLGPLKLGAADSRPGSPTEILVYPDMPAARRLVMAVRHGRFREEGRRNRGPLGLGTEFESIRDYLPDDDVRQVNWRATARMNRPMSNQFRVEQDREVIIVIDSGRLMAAPLGDRTRMDAAIDAAAAMAAVADEVGDRCGVVVFDDQIRRHVSPKRAGGTVVTRAIFDVEASDADSNYELAFRTVVTGKRAFVLVLTDLLEESAAAPLKEAMPLLTRRHAVAVASVQDPDVMKTLANAPQDMTDLYRQVVALDMSAAQRSVASTLRRTGADVIEAPVDRLSGHCVSAYLRSKRLARA